MCTQHELMVLNTYATGAQEWLCPTCGRRFIVQWSPQYQCVVLQTGDVTAPHNTGRGALVSVPREQSAPDARLSPWENWLTAVDLEQRLDEDET